MKDSGPPFCLIFASNDPHAPYQTGGYDPSDVYIPSYIVDTPETRQLIANYYTDINTVDRETGDILNLIDRLDLKRKADTAEFAAERVAKLQKKPAEE